ncbi:unnamed protein product [Agarophyton chilense]
MALPQLTLALCALVAAAAVLLALRLPPPVVDVLSFAARRQFAWGSSTTPVPISSVSVLAKSLLSHDLHSLPPPLHALVPNDDTISLQRVRDYTNALRLQRLRHLCNRFRCRFDRQEQRFGLTALHLAAAAADAPLTEWLLENGAQPLPDFAGRLPANLTFPTFIRYAKAVAESHHPDCDLPTVDFAADPQVARSEVRRLVNEGEPILMRGAYQFYKHADYPSLPQLVEQFGHVNVTVGAVPYADAFNLTTRRMTLVEYYDTIYKESATAPSYVFNKNSDICRTAYDALSALINDSFPLQLIVPPDQTGGLDGIHFFLGNEQSGAPFHVHADALNAAVYGTKQWYIFTPATTIYSRKTISEWVRDRLPSLPEEKRPLQCMQRAGDVVYVPLDWGHAVLNVEHDTFGVALEMLNTRDTYAHLWR